MPVTTSPSSVSSPSRPSKRVTAPRPHSETRSLAGVSAVSAKEEPVTRSRVATARHMRSRASSGSVSLFSQSASRGASRRDSSSRRGSRSSSVPSPACPGPRPVPASEPRSGELAPIRSPARLTSTPGAGAARIRPSTASITCSATVRPKRPIHAFGIGPLLRIVPVASASAIAAPVALDSTSLMVSLPSSWLSASSGTSTIFSVSPTSKVSVPRVAV